MNSNRPRAEPRNFQGFNPVSGCLKKSDWLVNESDHNIRWFWLRRMYQPPLEKLLPVLHFSSSSTLCPIPGAHNDDLLFYLWFKESLHMLELKGKGKCSHQNQHFRDTRVKKNWWCLRVLPERNHTEWCSDPLHSQSSLITLEEGDIKW